MKPKVILIENNALYLYNFRLPLAKAIRDWGAEVVLVCPPGEYVSKIEAEGFRWIPFLLDRRKTNPIKEIGTIIRLFHLYRKERPHLVHHFTIKPVIYGSLAARWVGKIVIVNSITGLGYIFTHESIETRLLRMLVQHLYRLALSKKNITIFQNPDDLKFFVDKGIITINKAKLIRGSGVNTGKFRPVKNPLSKGDDECVVLLASRMLKPKGIGEYVQAAKILRNEGVKVRFLLAGSPDRGNPTSVSPSEIEKWRAEGTVEVLGYCSNIVDLIAGSNIVVLPSYYGEGIPRILLEAAAMGKPIVATDIPGCREIVEDGVNGLLIQPKDVKALASAIRTLVMDEEMRERFGVAGHEKVKREFDEQLIFSEILKVYEELLDSK